ncbi:hypothetical protein GLM86_07595 [Campylobacter jejuni]|nr:hypothetical protein [Campylobacter jejuni]EDP3233362.1 hypothetical protein [Campylobacter jejuni]
MLRNVFDLMEFVSKYTKDLLDEFEELEEDGVDVYQYLNDYQAKYQAKLEEFFDSEYGEAFEFNASDIFGLKDEVKKAKKDFLLDIYSYASFEDFQKFNDYKKVAGFNYEAFFHTLFLNNASLFHYRGKKQGFYGKYYFVKKHKLLKFY